MAKKTYPRRYAQAAFQIALERGDLDRWRSDLEKIASLSKDATFSLVMENPGLRFNDKTKLLAVRLGDINPLALNLAYILAAKGRLSISGDIASEYQILLDSYRGIEQAEVITAIPLDDEDKISLAEHLSAMVGKKVVISPATDPKLLGGVVTRIGGKLIDGSTRSQLDALKKKLSGVRG